MKRIALAIISSWSAALSCGSAFGSEGDAAGPIMEIQESSRVVEEMKSDGDVADLLERAKGVFGSMAMILMSDKATNGFLGEGKFAISAEKGLAIVNWSSRTKRDSREGADIVVWSDTEGFLGEAAVGIADAHSDDEANKNYYSKPVTPQEIVAGEVKNLHSSLLRDHLMKY